jgi:hypothetical protein
MFFFASIFNNCFSPYFSHLDSRVMESVACFRKYFRRKKVSIWAQHTAMLAEIIARLVFKKAAEFFFRGN